MTEGGPPTPRLTLGKHCHKAVIDGLVEERRNSCANALELRLSSTDPSIRLGVWQNALWHTSSRGFSSALKRILGFTVNRIQLNTQALVGYPLKEYNIKTL